VHDSEARVRKMGKVDEGGVESIWMVATCFGRFVYKEGFDSLVAMRFRQRCCFGCVQCEVVLLMPSFIFDSFCFFFVL